MAPDSTSLQVSQVSSQHDQIQQLESRAIFRIYGHCQSWHYARSILETAGQELSTLGHTNPNRSKYEYFNNNNNNNTNNNNNNNNLFNISSFTISEANYRLTLRYHGISSSSLLSYTSFILLNHLFLTVSKYFPKFCMRVLFVIFIIFL